MSHHILVVIDRINQLIIDWNFHLHLITPKFGNVNDAFNVFIESALKPK